MKKEGAGVDFMERARKNWRLTGKVSSFAC